MAVVNINQLGGKIVNNNIPPCIHSIKESGSSHDISPAPGQVCGESGDMNEMV